MILGLTGGIASGKSSVADILLARGAILVSADQLAREVVKPGSPTLVQLVDAFGREIITPEGRLKRAVLARKVFADPAARRRLEAITHPAIAHLAESRLAALQATSHALIVYEAPLLFEAGAQGRVDLVLVVMVDPLTQLTRLQQRDKLDEIAAKQRIKAQWPQADKVAQADFVIDNSGPLPETRAMVEALYAYLTRSHSPGCSNS